MKRNELKQILKPLIKECIKEASDTRKQLLDAIGKDSYNGVNLFEGTEPLRQAAASSGISSSPLSNVDPGDAGVSIEGILAVGGSKWKALMGK